MNKKFLIAGVVATIAATGIGAATASANYGNMMNKQNQNFDVNHTQKFDASQLEAMKAKHESIQKAIEANDYSTWKNLIADTPMAKKNTEADFALAVERNKNHQVMEQKKVDIQKAIESNDYAKWKELSVGTPMADKITEANFPRLVEMHKLMTEAQKIGTELGIEKGFGDGSKMKGEKGMHGGGFFKTSETN